MGGLVAYASSDDEGEDETAREVNVQVRVMGHGLSPK